MGMVLTLKPVRVTDIKVNSTSILDASPSMLCYVRVEFLCVDVCDWLGLLVSHINVLEE